MLLDWACQYGARKECFQKHGSGVVGVDYTDCLVWGGGQRGRRMGRVVVRSSCGGILGLGDDGDWEAGISWIIGCIFGKNGEDGRGFMDVGRRGGKRSIRAVDEPWDGVWIAA